MCRGFVQSLLQHLQLQESDSSKAGSDGILRLLQQMMSLDMSTIVNSSDAHVKELVSFFVGLLSLRYGPLQVLVYK